jgi:hypothetical protein
MLLFWLLASRATPAGGGIAWHFFVQGSRLLFSGRYGPYHGAGGLHLYASYPSLQVGPLAFVVAQLIRLTGPDNGMVMAQLVLTAMGLATLGLIRQIAVAARPELTGSARLRWTYLAGGVVFMAGWQELAVAYAHLDDGLALLFAVLALWAAVHRRPALAGLAVGLSVASKPWALVFLPVLLIADGPGTRDRAAAVRASARAAAAAAAVIAVSWLPFYLADPGTIGAARYTIGNLPDSALRALGVTTARTPTWDRPAQIALGCLLGTLAFWRRRWPAVILLGVGARIALDPAAHGYYTPGVLAGALIWDMLGTRRPFPLWTLVSFGALNLVPLLTADAALRGDARLYLVIAFTTAILLAPARWRWQPDPVSRTGQARSREQQPIIGY